MKADVTNAPPPDPQGSASSPARPTGTSRHWVKPLTLGFVLLLAAQAAMLLLAVEPGPLEPWLAGGFWIMASLATLAGLARRLPLQNVIGCAVVIIAGFAIIGTIGAASGIPFGVRVYTRNLGAPLPGGLPWPVPLIGLVFLINSRGIARLIMRPWRKTHRYGFWVIGLTGALCVVLDAGLERFAMQLRHYWLWQTGGGKPLLLAAPWTNFLAWFLVAICILAFATPWLINKHPVKLPPDYHPLVVWSLLNLFFSLGNMISGHWIAATITIGCGFTAALFAVRGARW